MGAVDLISIHAAILLIWLLPGTLILLTIVLRYPRLIGVSWNVPFLLVSAFLLSLALNTIAAMASAAVTGRYDTTAIFVLAVCGGLIALLPISLTKLKSLYRRMETDLPQRLLLILVGSMFVIMLMNGGLIDMLADSWWHMSLANKIFEAKSIFLDKHHLLGLEVGSEKPVYPSLWHLNLAVLTAVTGQPLPMLWHVWGAYSVAFTVLSYFVLVKALFRNSYIALLGTVFFCVLLGGINSYFRVSPWPGNISYIFWYFLMALIFMMVDRYRVTLSSKYHDSPGWFGSAGFVRSLLSANRGLLLLAILCIPVIYGLHPGVLFWSLAGFVFYGISAALHRQKGKSMDVDRAVFVPPTVVILSGFLLWGIYDFLGNGNGLRTEWGRIVPFLPVALALLGIGSISIINRMHAPRGAYWIIVLSLSMLVAGFIDGTHIIELFQTDWGKTGIYRYHVPGQVGELPGQALYLPHWEHQLRGGLLLSGLAAIPLSIWLLIEKHNRGSVFLAGNMLLAVITLISPHVFTLFGKVIPLASVYRVQLLIFHPIVIGYAVFLLVERLRSGLIHRAA